MSDTINFPKDGSDVSINKIKAAFPNGRIAAFIFDEDDGVSFFCAKNVNKFELAYANKLLDYLSNQMVESCLRN